MGTAVINAHDPRVQRTRQQLVQALIALAAVLDVRTLTVQQITARAGVNRVTFYAHFPHAGRCRL